MLRFIKQMWDAGEHWIACIFALNFFVMLPLATIAAVLMTIELIRYLLLGTP